MHQFSSGPQLLRGNEQKARILNNILPGTQFPGFGSRGASLGMQILESYACLVLKATIYDLLVVLRECHVERPCPMDQGSYRNTEAGQRLRELPILARTGR